MNSFGLELTKVAFEVILPDLYSHLKTKIANIKIKNESNIKEKYSKAISIENVKTIWQVDKSVNLNNFYHSPKLSNEHSPKLTIKSLSEFPPAFKCVIEGTAGQGKSIFLRYLAGQELKSGSTIPIFIELRKITGNKNLESLILDNLSELGINVSSSDLDILFDSRKITLLLDAFDEISEDYISDTLNYIEHLSLKFSTELKIIISSRFDHAIQSSNHFNVYEICPLKEEDFAPILDKFYSCKEESKTEEIINALNSNGNEIKQVLVTPLLLTMLTITYNSYHKLPDNLPEFYNNIFHLLANRHDLTKPGYRRTFHSNLNEHELEKLFCCFSFLCQTHKEQRNHFTFSLAVDIAKEAINLESFEHANSVGFINDSVRNTCLLVKEGYEYHFIHRSIMEYFSSKFLINSIDDLRARFFSKCIKSVSFRKHNEGVLNFCKVISLYKYLEEFKIPLLRKAISISDKEKYINNIIEQSFDNLEIVIDGNYQVRGYAGLVLTLLLDGEYSDVINPFKHVTTFFNESFDSKKYKIPNLNISKNQDPELIREFVKFSKIVDLNSNLMEDFAYHVSMIHEERILHLKDELKTSINIVDERNKKLNQLSF